MGQDFYITIIYKKIKGEITEIESKQLDNWLHESERNTQLYNEIAQQWNLSENYNPDIEIDVKADFLKLKERIKKSEKSKSNSQGKIIKFKLWQGIAASLLIIISTALWLYNTSASRQITVSTVQNEIKHIILPDGSEIWLNANSEIKYPEKFASKERKVSMSGEIFFQVKKNKKAPFIIDAIQTEIKVLGTSFNVKINRSTKETKVDLKTGKVLFSSKISDDKIILVKGEAAIFNETNHSFTKTKYDENSFAWKSSVLLFKEKLFLEVIKTIEKQYKVNIVFDNKQLANCVFSGRFENKNIDEVLQYLSDIYGFKVQKLSASKYKLTGGLCQ